jgi:glycosyltransferase involved in cell wall biosynthesis
MHIIYNLEHGGAQEVLCVLAEAQRGPENVFIVCAFGDGPMRARLEEAGATVEIIRGPSFSYKSIFRYLAEIKRIGDQIAALAKLHKINIIQTHALGILDLAIIRLRHVLRETAILWTLHSGFLPLQPGRARWARHIIRRRMYRAIAARADAIACVSANLMRTTIAEFGNVNKRIHAIPNAPNPRKFTGVRPVHRMRASLGVPSGSGVVLFLGRLAPVKGCDFLIKAAPIVLANAPNTIFLVAGDGSEAEVLKAMAEQAGATKQVRFLGSRDDTADLLAAADVFCLPSRQEGMSLALLEAMSAGKAVVVSDISANREIVEHGKTGLLIPVGNIAALAEALVHLLAHPEAANAMGHAAKGHAAASSGVAVQHGAFANLYREILTDRIRR